MITRLEQSIGAVARWVESHDYHAYDPGDGSLSFLSPLTLDNPFLARLLTAAVLRSPFNIRPLLGIRPHRSTKGTAYMAWGYIKLHAVTGDVGSRERAEECLQWLIENRSPGFKPYCWGNHFDFSTRAGRSRAMSPIMPWTALIGQAFLEAYQTLGNARYFEIAASVCEWILSVPREDTGTGACLSYVPDRQSSIHNANMLGASVLAQVGVATGRREALQVAHEAMRYSCSRQRADGAWMYGEAGKYQWNDSFHTGYNLDSLKRYVDVTGNQDFAEHMQRGFNYFKGHFFEPDGRPKYYDNETYPIDIQCAAQGIDTLAFFSDVDNDTLALACKVAHWTIEHMQARDGHFYYRDLGWRMIRTPMLHWGQGTSFKALAHLVSKLKERQASGGQPQPAQLARVAQTR